MHQLGLSAADVAARLHGEAETWEATLEKFEAAAVNAGMAPAQAARYAMVQYAQQFATELLEANNRKIAADLVRLGVLKGTITREGGAAF